MDVSSVEEVDEEIEELRVQVMDKDIRFSHHFDNEEFHELLVKVIKFCKTSKFR